MIHFIKVSVITLIERYGYEPEDLISDSYINPQAIKILVPQQSGGTLIRFMKDDCSECEDFLIVQDSVEEISQKIKAAAASVVYEDTLYAVMQENLERNIRQIVKEALS